MPKSIQVKSKSYKGVRDFTVVAVLPCPLADATDATPVAVTVKAARLTMEGTPWKITVGEWRAAGKASFNPNYDYMMLFRRFNPEGYPLVARLADEAIKACKELLGAVETPRLTPRR